MTTESVCFKIEGEWLSSFARTLVVEGKWMKALRVLQEDVGLSYEQGIKLLRGRADLVGVNEFELVDISDDDQIAKDMDAKMDWLYGNVFEHNGRHWKPYAYVTRLNHADFDFAKKWTNSNTLGVYTGLAEPKSYGGVYLYRRAFAYANNPSNDLVLHIGKQVPILCEAVDPPPMWIIAPKDGVAHIIQRYENGKLNHLEERGANADEEISLPNNEDDDLEETESPADQYHRIQQRNQELEKIESERVVQRVLEIIDIRKKVTEQADKIGGWITLDLTKQPGYAEDVHPKSIRVPKNPFLHWALRRFDFEGMGKSPPPWDLVSYSGMKMMMDDPYHTDWWIGAGLDLDNAYERRGDSLETIANSAAFSEMFEINREWSKSDFVILAGCGSDVNVYAEIHHPKPNKTVPAGSIAVVPHAGPEYQNAMMSANKKDKHGNRGMIICETGGKLAHLAVVGREMECNVLMVPNALKKFKTGSRAQYSGHDRSLTIY